MKKMRKKISYPFTAQHIMLLLFAFTVVFLTVVAIVPNNDDVDINNEVSRSYNENWQLDNTGETINLPYIYPTKAHDIVSISRKLDDVFDSGAMAMSFISSMQTVTVSIDGEVFYRYCQQPNRYFDVNPPPAWHVVRLSPDMIGKTLQITYTAPIQNYAGVLNPIAIGTKHAVFTDMAKSSLVGLLICFSIIIFGVFSIVIYLFIRRKLHIWDGLFYLGLFSVLIGVWSACETKSMQIFTGNVQLIMFSTFLSIMLAPVPLLLFFREQFRGRLRKAYNVGVVLFAAYFVIMIVLQVMGVATLNDPFFAFLTAVFCMCVFIAGSSFYQYRKNRTAENMIPLIAISVLSLCVSVDMVRYLFGSLALTSNSDTSLFIRVGILLFILILGYSTINRMAASYVESTKVDAYRAMAHTDSLSCIHNRMYLMEIYPKIFGSAVRNLTPFSVIMIDIDNFKSYNDNYGHTMGDEVIKSVAELLKATAKRPLDTVIRYGGEEFLIVLPDIAYSGAIHVAEQIQQKFREVAIPHAFSAVESFVTVSQGIYCAVPSANSTLEEFIEYADKALYCAKRNGKNQYACFDC